jgi:hypothetical protein
MDSWHWYLHRNSDCTGSAVINTPSDPVPLNIHFVILITAKKSIK